MTGEELAGIQARWHPDAPSAGLPDARHDIAALLRYVQVLGDQLKFWQKSGSTDD